jgi:hypothetical protein
MIIGFARRHGRGNGKAAVEYVAAGATSYVTGERDSRGTLRARPPEVLRGDPAVTAALIRSVPFQFKYVSGMLSFSADEPATPQLQQAAMDQFERHAFAGLKRGVDFDILWVRHTERHPHLHFIAPRVHLRSGRSLNPSPPGSRNYFDLLRTKLNLEFNLFDPTDPARAQAVRLPNYLARLRSARADKNESAKLDLREVAAQHILAKVREGSVTNRADVASALRSAGLTIRREGENYITIIDPETGRPIRLRGTVFERGTKLRELFSQRSAPTVHENTERLREVTEQLEKLRVKREQYNHQRYGQLPEPTQTLQPSNLDRFNNAPAHPLETCHDRSRTSVGYSDSRIASTIPPARNGCEPALERFDRASRHLELSSGRLDHACRKLNHTFERRQTWRREREADAALIKKYASHYRETYRVRESDMEMEREIERL